jgi:signal transduction histidine kinase
VLRQLRGLRVQLLLWTILPLAVVLVILSVAGIARHRQAMTRLVEDRDRGLTLAEANRLGRDIDRRVAMLARAVASLDGESVAGLEAGLGDAYVGGLALLDATGTRLAASETASWLDHPEPRVLAARTAAVGQPQFELDFATDHDPVLLVGVPVGTDRVLIGAVPVETLDLTGSSALMESETHGAVFILDATGRRVHHHNPAGLSVDGADFADLPLAPDVGVGTANLRRGNLDLLVTSARVEPPGWTLVTAEDMRAMTGMGMSVVEVLPLVLLFVAVVALLALSFGVIYIVRPLQELDRRAARVAWGDFDAVQQPVGGVQEMDDLRATLAQMAERIRTYQTGMRDYLSAVTQAQEAERARLAHELHDDTVQALIALKQRAQMAHKALGPSTGSGQAPNPERAASRLDELEKLIDQELISLRRLIGDLRPIYLEDLGFVPALEMLVRQVGERHALDVRLVVRGETVRLAPDLELAAFRIVQQALANVAAHAQAQHAVVSVAFARDGLTLSVRDDGRGFVPPDQPADLVTEGHFGLMGMRERAMLYGGHLTIDSSPGKGTTITARLPVC